MKRLCAISVMFLFSTFFATAHAGYVEADWENIQDGYFSGIVWVTGNVTSDEVDFPGGLLCLGIRVGENGQAGPSQVTIGANGYFQVAIVDPLNGSPSPINYILVAWDDTFGNYDYYEGDTD